ncbi:MAG: hypothetical protein ABJE95_00785 [Byssovorax sp.]
MTVKMHFEAWTSGELYRRHGPVNGLKIKASADSNRAASLEVREGGPLATVLEPLALEILVVAGDLEDFTAFTALVRRMPATAEVLDAIARFGHPDSGAYLMHWLSEDGLARALETLFGPIVGGAERGRPAAWREALARGEVSAGVRCSRGRPWSVEALFAECTSGSLARGGIEGRLDELAARTGLAPHVDLALWARTRPRDGAPLAPVRGRRRANEIASPSEMHILARTRVVV